MGKQAESLGTLLVVAAHPDDEVLGCGGTVARLVGEGWKASVLILGEGHSSRFQSQESADAEGIEALRRQSRMAGDILGADEVLLEGLPDNRFDTVPLLDIVKRIEGVVETVRPDMVFTQHGGDLNIDHTITFRAVMTAVRPMQGLSVHTLLAFEAPSSSEWAFHQFAPAFRPNVFFDISGTLETKIRAMQVYEGEVREYPHPRSPRAIRAKACNWGAGAGFEAAEAFEAVWQRR